MGVLVQVLRASCCVFSARRVLADAPRMGLRRLFLKHSPVKYYRVSGMSRFAVSPSLQKSFLSGELHFPCFSEPVLLFLKANLE